jgi:anti-sigma factor RsiW
MNRIPLSGAGPLTCRELVELITDYLEHALSEPDRLRFEEHLQECDGCQQYVEQMRRTLHTLGRLPEESLSSPARERLLDTIHAWTARR